MRAETSVPQFLHAYEAAKHLCDALHRDRRKMTRLSLALTTATEMTTELNQHHSDTVSIKTEDQTFDKGHEDYKAVLLDYVGVYSCT